MFTALHHVQLAIPKGGEPRARAFYSGALGMHEIPKPAQLSGRGGCWFRAGLVELHLGVEDPFTPARKAHPAFTVDDLSAAEAQCRTAAIPVTRDADLPNWRRFFIADPFGNRIEILALR